MDLFEFETRQSLIVTDYVSSFGEIDNMTSTTSAAVIRKIKSIFAWHGVPDKLRSDNGPRFISEHFRDRSFATEWGFRHCTASPRYPQSNGKAENSVKTAKAIMQKARQTGEDVWLAVLTWRNDSNDRILNFSSSTAIWPQDQYRNIASQKRSPEPRNPTECSGRIQKGKRTATDQIQ